MPASRSCSGPSVSCQEWFRHWNRPRSGAIILARLLRVWVTTAGFRSTSKKARANHHGRRTASREPPPCGKAFWTPTTWMFYLLTCLAIMCRMGHQFYLQIKAPTSYRSNMHGDEGACVSGLHMEVAVVFYCRHRPDPDLRVIILLFQCSPTETQPPTAI